MKVVIVGGGISATALLCYFVREEPEWFAAQEWLILEKSARIGVGDLGKYKIRSNSVLPAFRSIIPPCVQLDPVLQALLDNVGQDYAPLALVSEMMAGVATCIVNRYDNVTAKTNSLVSFEDMESMEADCIVNATGAVQTIPSEYLCYRNVLTSTDVLCNSYDFTNQKIAIVGASHSGWSVVWSLLQDYRRPFGSIDLIARHAPRVFFRDADAAALDDYEYGDDDICPETNQIHRFGGLRGDSKQVWRNHRNGLYPNIHLVQAPDLSKYDCIVIAYNYARRMPGCIDFGLMSHTRLLAGEKSFTGSKDGIWLYSNDLAKIVKNHMLKSEKIN